MKTKNSELEHEINMARDKLRRAQENKAQPLRYSDLYPPGILSKSVSSFTFFATVEQNDAFLDLLNFADGSPGSFPRGDGLCENARLYSKVTWEERSGKISPPSLNPDSDEYAGWLRRSRARQELGWKDRYLLFCIYLRSGATMKFVATLGGVGLTTMSNIFRSWLGIMDDALREMFPRPTRSQFLRVYPIRFIEADGHA